MLTLLQLGILTYIAALTTIELALTHAAVYKVHCQPLATILPHMTLQPHMCCHVQAVWTQLWQMIIVMLGIAMLTLALQQDRSKLPVHVQMQSMSTLSHPGKLQ